MAKAVAKDITKQKTPEQRDEISQKPSGRWKARFAISPICRRPGIGRRRDCAAAAARDRGHVLKAFGPRSEQRLQIQALCEIGHRCALSFSIHHLAKLEHEPVRVRSRSCLCPTGS